MKNTKYELNDNELNKVSGGLAMTNPVAGLTEEEAKKIAYQLDEGKDMGSWKTMSGEQFLDWWYASNKDKEISK